MQRRILEDAVRRADGDPASLRYTPEELADFQRARAGRPWPDGPIPLLPVTQVYLRDVPSLHPPDSADLLQVLWCPFSHAKTALPETAVFWRTAASVTEVLTTPPETSVIEYHGYLPHPCLLSPEEVTEYPHSTDLEHETLRQVQTCRTWQVAAEPDDLDEDEPTPEDVYNWSLSVSPGWKIGGWTRWGLTDPHPRLCDVCGSEMDSLLTIASSEWGETSKSWIPHEDRDVSASPLDPYPEQPTKVQIADGNNLHLYVCPTSLEHPHLTLIQ
ncbi:non-ribosomal peptide synthetase [Streptomyces sp. NPDC056883]|uniref:non-ribosomal peptide synthetase n=1 Tax=Streptomyces sp. NPDC056883 TaxID=3345959 RepID=UPI0036BC77D6